MSNEKLEYSKIDKYLSEKILKKSISKLESNIATFGESFYSHLYYGKILSLNGEDNRAIDEFSKALKLNPNNMDIMSNLGTSFVNAKRYNEAFPLFNKILAIDPQHIDTLIMITYIFTRTGFPVMAKTTAELILKIQPENISTLSDLANVNSLIGNISDSIFYHKKILSLNPNKKESRSGLLLASLYGEFDNNLIIELHKKHSAYFINNIIRHQTKLPLSDKITIGYVSPDWKQHSVAYFLESLLSNHDKEKFKIIGYSNTTRIDDVTDKLKGYCDIWRDISNKRETDTIKQIQDDKVDILIDLAGHTGGNSLEIFGAKPAPIQLSYIGYPTSTGLSTINYRITDPIADPISDNSNENLIHLNRFFLAYTPLEKLPNISFNKREYTLFGSFNNSAKYSDKTIRLWSRVLNSVPNSKLYIKHRNFNDEKMREILIEKFNKHNIAREQLIFREACDTTEEHLLEYNNIDLALDPTPYNGTTTTIEALLMGVPTISLRGDRHSDRVGVSILTNIKEFDFIAENSDEFVNIAIYFDKNRDELLKIKKGLRDKLLNSPICDSKGLTKELESNFIELIKKY